MTKNEPTGTRLRMHESTVKERLRQQPGRIKTDPAICGGRPHIHRKEIDVLAVLKMLEDGRSDKAILQKYRKMNEQDLDACRAYQATVISKTLKAAFKGSAQPFFMLDENTSYFMLPDVVRIFGPSSHVFAEGLIGDRNDDEKDIWSHMVENKYRVILTMDNDFKRISISQRHRIAEENGSVHDYDGHIPSVISLPGLNNAKDVIRLLEKHQDAIREFVEQKSILFAVLTEAGLVVPPYCSPRAHNLQYTLP